MDLNMKVQSDLNVKVHQEKWSRSMHRLTSRSETAESGRTVHFVPAGAESTHHQQQGARPKQIAVSIFPDHQKSNAATRDAANAVGAVDNATNAARMANAATFLRGIGRGLGNRFLLPQGYETMAWEEKQIWDERVDVLMKRVLPQLASGFRPNLRAWRKAPENWPCPGQTNEDTLKIGWSLRNRHGQTSSSLMLNPLRENRPPCWTTPRRWKDASRPVSGGSSCLMVSTAVRKKTYPHGCRGGANFFWKQSWNRNAPTRMKEGSAQRTGPKNSVCSKPGGRYGWERPRKKRLNGPGITTVCNTLRSLRRSSSQMWSQGV